MNRMADLFKAIKDEDYLTAAKVDFYVNIAQSSLRRGVKVPQPPGQKLMPTMETTAKVIVVLIAGLPLAAVLSWVFDLTAHGLRRTPGEPDGGESAACGVLTAVGDPSSGGRPAGFFGSPPAAGSPPLGFRAPGGGRCASCRT